MTSIQGTTNNNNYPIHDNNKVATESSKETGGVEAYVPQTTLQEKVQNIFFGFLEKAFNLFYYSFQALREIKNVILRVEKTTHEPLMSVEVEDTTNVKN